MSFFGRIAALCGAAVLVAGCGGGGSSSVAPQAKASASGTPAGTGTLTLHYPASFHTATFLPSQKQSNRRAPAYINPASGTIDILINGTDAITAGVSPSQSDGTQSFTIPLFSGSDEVVAVETESGLQGGNGTIIAIGETDVQQGYIGGPLTLNLTMEENVQSIGLMTSATGTNATIGSPFDPAQCVSQGSTLTVFPFAADPTGGFAVNDGAGGSAVPSLVSFTDPGQQIGSGTNYGNGVNFDLVNASASGTLTGYTVTFSSQASEASLGNYFPADLNFSVPNPAAAIYNDAENAFYSPGTGQYPGIEKLYNTGSLVLPIQSLSSTNPLTATIAVEPNEDGC